MAQNHNDVIFGSKDICNCRTNSIAGNQRPLVILLIFISVCHPSDVSTFDDTSMVTWLQSKPVETRVEPMLDSTKFQIALNGDTELEVRAWQTKSQEQIYHPYITNALSLLCAYNHCPVGGEPLAQLEDWSWFLVEEISVLCSAQLCSEPKFEPSPDLSLDLQPHCLVFAPM